MKTIILAISLIFATAKAADSTTALRIVCMPMNSHPEFYSCLQTFVKYSYYDESALHICASMDSNFDKIFCLDSIGDATFEKDEISLCASKFLDIEKQECLDTHGQQNP